MKRIQLEKLFTNKSRQAMYGSKVQHKEFWVKNFKQFNRKKCKQQSPCLPPVSQILLFLKLMPKLPVNLKWKTWASSPIRINKGYVRFSDWAIYGGVASLPCFASSARQDVTQWRQSSWMSVESMVWRRPSTHRLSMILCNKREIHV